MKIVVTGASGMLGKDLVEVLTEHGHEVTGTSRASGSGGPAQWVTLDVTKAPETYNVISRINPDVVIHAASYNDVDGAEKDPRAAFSINALGTRNVALACQRFDTPLVHLSTDYVFDGSKKTPYDEWDSTSPLGQYARSKSWAEQFVTTLLRRFYVVRVSWLFGSGRANFVDRLLEAGRTKKKVFAATDMVSSPTYCQDLAEALASLIEQPHYGIYHVTGGGHCSRYDWAKAVLALAGLPKDTARPCTRRDLKLPAARPAFSALGSTHWTLNGFKPMRPWQDALESYIKEGKHHG